MGSSKYEFNPEQFEIDVQNNINRYMELKDNIKEELHKIILQDPSRMSTTFTCVLEVLREIKQEYNL